MGANAARLFVPPWLDPTEPNIDAILMQEMNMMGTAMAADLTAAGKTGVAIHGVYDFWTPSRHYHGVSRRAAAADGIGQRADRLADDHDTRTRSPTPRWATIRASVPGITWSRGWAARGACATSSTTS